MPSRIFYGCCTETQEEPGKVVHPVCRSAADAERVLEAAVETLYHPIRLRVVSHCLAVLDADQAAQGGPQGGCELGPAV